MRASIVLPALGLALAGCPAHRDLAGRVDLTGSEAGSTATTGIAQTSSSSSTDSGSLETETSTSGADTSAGPETSTASSTSSAGHEASSGDSSGSMPATPWPSDFEPNPVEFDCSTTRAQLEPTRAPRVVTPDDRAIFGGYRTSGNRDAILARFDGDTLVWCLAHEAETPSSELVGISWDGGPQAYLTYRVFGGGTALADAAASGWLWGYAPSDINGGGFANSYIGRIDADNGQLVEGTFLIGVQDDRGSSGHDPIAAVEVEPDRVVFFGRADPFPIDVNLEAMTCTENGPYESMYVLTLDLTDLICATVLGCTPARPCE